MVGAEDDGLAALDVVERRDALRAALAERGLMNGWRPYLDLVSLSWRTGDAETRASISSKSELATGSLKTMVLSSGVSMAFRPSLSAEVSL